MRSLRITKQITNRDALSLDLYFGEVNKLNLLTMEEEINLATKIKNGDLKALEMLISSNLRFVISVAKQYQNKGLTLSDLINEGNVGLIKAAERFDETKGFRFISYAVWWIRQSILQSIAENSRMVRLPLNKLGTIAKINSAFAKLDQVFQREPFPEEVAEMLNFRLKVVEEAIQTSIFKISTDAPLRQGESGEITLYDTLVNSDEPSTDMPLLQDSLNIEIERSLAILGDREAVILRHYFGLAGTKALCIEEIAVELNLRRERVRQLKDKAIKKLKNKQIKCLLRPYLD